MDENQLQEQIKFLSTYINVLKGKFDKLTGDCISLETQLALTQEKHKEKDETIAKLKKDLEKVAKDKSKTE